MKVYREISLSEFEFWAGAKDRVKYLTEEELVQIEQILEDIYPEGMSEFEVNDLFWFAEELIAEWLGYENFDEIMTRNISILDKTN